MTYVPDLKSLLMEGRMQFGGTRIRVKIKSWGCPTSGFMSRNGRSCSENWNKATRLLFTSYTAGQQRNKTNSVVTSSGIALKRFNTMSGFNSSWKTTERKICSAGKNQTKQILIYQTKVYKNCWILPATISKVVIPCPCCAQQIQKRIWHILQTLCSLKASSDWISRDWFSAKHIFCKDLKKKNKWQFSERRNVLRKERTRLLKLKQSDGFLQFMSSMYFHPNFSQFQISPL